MNPAPGNQRLVAGYRVNESDVITERSYSGQICVTMNAFMLSHLLLGLEAVNTGIAWWAKKSICRKKNE